MKKWFVFLLLLGLLSVLAGFRLSAQPNYRFRIDNLSVGPVVLSAAQVDTLQLSFQLVNGAGDTFNIAVNDSLEVVVNYLVLDEGDQIVAGPGTVGQLQISNLANIQPGQPVRDVDLPLPVQHSALGNGGNIVVVWPTGSRLQPPLPGDTARATIVIQSVDRRKHDYPDLRWGPNPTRDELVFSVAILVAEATDPLGRTVPLTVRNGRQVQVAELPKGVYRLRLIPEAATGKPILLTIVRE